MNTKNWNVWAFVAMVILQLTVVCAMIFTQERTIQHGEELKFRLAPIDPNDPFRGKYMQLAFTDTEVPISASDSWGYKDPVLVRLETDAEGFAIPQQLYPKSTPMSEDHVYCVATISYMPSDTNIAHINYPFDKFYMNEYVAPQAEKAYFDLLRDTSAVAYGLVKVKAGNAVLLDVIVNDQSIKHLGGGQ